MTPSLQRLIESLREELKQYGEMLAILDQQQECVLSRHTQDLLRTVVDIHAQAAQLQDVRRQRQHIQQDLTRELRADAKASIADLTRLVPADYQPLLQALVEENNQLLIRVQHRARQNHLLLNRSLELLQRFINVLAPGNAPVYNESGALLSAPLSTQPLYEAVG